MLINGCLTRILKSGDLEAKEKRELKKKEAEKKKAQGVQKGAEAV